MKKKIELNNSHPYLEIIYSYSKHTVTVLFIKDMLYIRQVWVCFRRLIYIINTKSYVLFWSHKMKIKLPLTAKGKRVTAMILRYVRITVSALKKKTKKGETGLKKKKKKSLKR